MWPACEECSHSWQLSINEGYAPAAGDVDARRERHQLVALDHGQQAGACIRLALAVGQEDVAGLDPVAVEIGLAEDRVSELVENRGVHRRQVHRLIDGEAAIEVDGIC